jgi:hypothetical protein
MVEIPHAVQYIRVAGPWSGVLCNAALPLQGLRAVLIWEAKDMQKVSKIDRGYHSTGDIALPLIPHGAETGLPLSLFSSMQDSVSKVSTSCSNHLPPHKALDLYGNIQLFRVDLPRPRLISAIWLSCMLHFTLLHITLLSLLLPQFLPCPWPWLSQLSISLLSSTL